MAAARDAWGVEALVPRPVGAALELEPEQPDLVRSPAGSQVEKAAAGGDGGGDSSGTASDWDGSSCDGEEEADQKVQPPPAVSESVSAQCSGLHEGWLGRLAAAASTAFHLQQQRPRYASMLQQRKQLPAFAAAGLPPVSRPSTPASSMPSCA